MRDGQQVLMIYRSFRVPIACGCTRIFPIATSQAQFPEREHLQGRNLAGIIWSNEEYGTAQGDGNFFKAFEIADRELCNQLEISLTCKFASSQLR